MSVSKYVGRKTLIAAALAVAFVGTASGASEREVRIDPRMAAAMERDNDITAEQLPACFRAEREALAKEAQPQSQFGRNFAGAWMERGANGEFKHVVVATSNAKAGCIPGSEIRQVRHSLRQLEDTMSGLNGIRSRAADARKLQGLQSWYVDVRTNSVVVSVAPGAMLKAVDFVAVSPTNVDTIRFEAAEGVTMPAASVVAAIVMVRAAIRARSVSR